MKKKNLVILLIMVLLGLIPTIICIMYPPKKAFKAKQPQQSGAGIAMDDFYKARAYPNETIDHSKFEAGYQQHKIKKSEARFASNTEDVWEAIGPKNFGGRMIGLAFNPQNPNTIYGGSATGGLWRTTTAGIGATAWEYVPTGFPVLGVMAIAVNPVDSNEIYIGTGEVYYYQNVGVGIGDRTSRGTYGIGILKSSDNGNSWTKVLDWDFGDLKGVSDLHINPENPNSVWAATSEGLFVSYDAGQNWTLKVDALNATDIIMHPEDTTIMLVACGNFASADHGIYRSLSGGDSFVKLNEGFGSGLPTTWSGKVMLDIQQNAPFTILASIGDTFETQGLYESTNNGGTWQILDLQCDQSTGCDAGPVDYALYQGWFSHDIAIHPENENEIVVVGVEAWKSDDGGNTLKHQSDWWSWDFSATPIGGPEGGPNYCHADIHRVLYHPTNYNEVYYATDGGMFVSQDGGLTFEGRNGNLQTQQFYADFSNSAQDSLFALGGLQDNSTTIYEGNLAWRREIGGDGLSTAVDPTNDNIVFGSSQYLNIRKSTNKAQSFSGVGVPQSGLPTAFAGPYAMCQTNTDILYAGRSRVFRTDNGAANWSTSSDILDGNPVLRIAIAHDNCDLVYACTAPTENDEINLFKSIDGGQNFENVTGDLPERFILDIVVHPENEDWVYVALGGYDSQHIFKSEDGAQTWQSISEGLPDLPVNTIVIDTVGDNHIYIGNDIGVYVSNDDGANWDVFDTGLPDAVLAMDVSISPLDRRIRVATHGSGVYQRPLIEFVEPMDTMPDDTMIVAVLDDTILDWNIYPNPVKDILTIDLKNNKVDAVRLYNMNGQLVKSKTIASIFGPVEMDVSYLPAGQYELLTEFNGTTQRKKVLKQ